MIVSGLDQRHVRSSLKRSACDRCRSQKLRCLRDIGDGAACKRCIRASVPCVTSPPRPPGRPVRNTPPVGNTPPVDQRSATGRDAGTITGGPQRPGAEGITGTASSTSSRYSTAAPESRGNAGTESPAAITSSRSHHLTGTTSYPALEIDGTGIIPLDWTFTDDAGFLKGPFSEESGTGSAPTFDDGPPISDVFHPHRWFDGSSPLVCGSVQSMRAASAEADGAGNPGSSPPRRGDQLMASRDDISDVSFHLCQLNLSLSKQLLFFTTRSWEDAMTAILCPGDDLGTQEPVEPNPLGEVLRNTSEFLSILQRLNPSPAPGHGKERATQPRGLKSPPPSRRSPLSPERGLISDSATPISSITPPPSYETPAPSTFGSATTNNITGLNIATALSLLSTYLHLIAIYDALFRHMLSSLSRTPASSISALQTVPDLQLAGVPVLHGGLQIKMLIQVIEHHLEAIDGALGLPVEYRVCGVGAKTRRGTGRTGLLSGVEWEGLLHAVMGGPAAPAAGPGAPDIMSLRENIRRVERYL